MGTDIRLGVHRGLPHARHLPPAEPEGHEGPHGRIHQRLTAPIGREHVEENNRTMTTAHNVRVTSLTCEHLREPLGIGVPRPRLSWSVATAATNWVQSAYEVEVSGASTGRVESAGSVLVAWPSAELGSRERRAVRVRVWGNDGTASDWSAPVHVEAGLLAAADWHAGAASVPAGWHRPPPGPAFHLRRSFQVRGPVVRARLYGTAHGLYELSLNGQVVGDSLLAPGWTSYSHRLRYS